MRQPVIGQRFVHGGDTGKVVGVVKDFPFRSMHDKIGPLVIARADASLRIFVRTRPGQVARAISDGGAAWNKFLPGYPFEYNFLDTEFDNLYKNDSKVSRLIGIFSGIAVALSALGLFALTAFAAQQRIREIGIRRVLGASFMDVIALLSVDFLKLVLIAIVIACPVAGWLMHAWLQDFAYRTPLEAWMFLLAGGLAILVAGVTISFHAGKAAMANPVESLRTE